jgi:HK97 family phage portal protein
MANFLQKYFTRQIAQAPVEERTSVDWQNPVLGTLNYGSYSSYNQALSLKIATLWRCVNLLSDSIASLPLYPYVWRGNWKVVDETNSLYNLLNVQANSFQGAYIFKKLAVIQTLLKGNAYILIDRVKTGEVLSLTLLNPDYIQIQVNGVLITAITDVTALGDNLDIKYVNTLSQRVYDKSQIVHLINYPDANGLGGISTLGYAASVLNLAYNVNEHSSGFFKGGTNLAGILRPIAGVNITKEKSIKAKQDFINSLTPSLGGTSGGLVVLDSGLEYQPISLNAVDSEMMKNKSFNVLEICRFFNVPPSLAFSETAKYSTAEQQSLDFLNNGLLPLCEKIENEMFRKLYLPSQWLGNELRFDVENIIRLDAKTKIDVLKLQIECGVKTPNEGRTLYNMSYPVTGGNKAFISTNLQLLDNPAVQGQAPQTQTSGSTNTNNTINNIAK